MIRVVIQDEDGNEVSEGVDVPTSLLSRLDDPRFSCLRYVDPYGDTVFNRVQLSDLLQDLRTIGQSCQARDHEPEMRRIERLVERCQKEPHLYVRMIGD